MQFLLGPQRTSLFLLIAEIIVLLGLFYGFYLIRFRRKAKAHHHNQTTFVLVNLGLILLVMVFGFYRYVVQGGAASPAVARMMIGHAAVGTVAELMGIYILIGMGNRLPERLQITKPRGIMRLTLALWTLAAIGGFVIYYAQYIATAPSGKQTGTSTPAPFPTTVGAFALAGWSDREGPNDSLTLIVADLPPQAYGTVYQGWLVSSASAVFESLGILEVSGDGTGLLAYRSPGAINLLGAYDRVLVTEEKSPAGKAGPSTSTVLAGKMPSQAGIHLQHLLVQVPGSPLGLGSVDALRLHMFALVVHSNEIESARRRGNLDSMKRHAEHVINLVEGQSGKDYGDLNRDGFVQDPGDGYGLLAYAALASAQARLANDAADATPAIATHAPHVITTADNISKWATQVRDHALTVINAASLQGMESTTTNSMTLSARALAGYDGNDDGVISPIPNEGGLVQLQAHAKMMATLVLRAGPGVPMQTLRQATPPARPTPTPSPGPQTATVLMEEFVYKEKTMIIKKGTTVIWVNNDQAAHNVVHDAGGFRSGSLARGATYSFSFNEAGRFPYFCEFHGDKGGIDMAGLVVVD
ncbi:MAG: cupredoxin domain-containing protein [Chloroflexi bacterium]|nr:cupredoxin domain-containing protein [Chloroflexota bacterium]